MATAHTRGNPPRNSLIDDAPNRTLANVAGVLSNCLGTLDREADDEAVNFYSLSGALEAVEHEQHRLAEHTDLIPSTLNPLIYGSHGELPDTVAHACAVLEVLTCLTVHDGGSPPTENYDWGVDLILETIIEALKYAVDRDGKAEALGLAPEKEEETS